MFSIRRSFLLLANDGLADLGRSQSNRNTELDNETANG